MGSMYKEQKKTNKILSEQTKFNSKVAKQISNYRTNITMKNQMNPNTLLLFFKKGSAFLVLLCFVFQSCLSFKEDRLTLSKQQVGEPLFSNYKLFSVPTVTENALVFEIEGSSYYKYIVNTKITTSLKRDKSGALCSGIKNSSEPDCDDGDYFFGLGLASVLTVGLIIPVLLVFDWIPALFKTGEKESVEEVSELKAIKPCQLKGEKAFLEYSFDDYWNRSKKIPLKDCSGKIPFNQEFNSNYQIIYRLVIDGSIQDSNRFAYHSNGDAIEGTESKTFRKIRKNADRILEREEQRQEVVRNQQRSEEIAQCENFFDKLGRYLNIKAEPGSSRATCYVTCHKYVITEFQPAKLSGKLPECTNRCEQCWSTLGWDAGKEINILNYYNLTTPQSY
ncbi:hypothetical protein [Leptospira santarosai]|uniref:Uncharacterized protein n=1 Tax=Leptospira santarosai serovar Arenal str. MAVJ 401 TaxID=1049976 RepID=M6JNB3_9LEPT|nr:hypothetical protein [Leptospira santarosai]EMN21103.1 hypothetical protein LEP1GSC063_1230 [Leptospira santarosai serovar Arenal str. MAVJ 401]